MTPTRLRAALGDRIPPGLTEETLEQMCRDLWGDPAEDAEVRTRTLAAIDGFIRLTEVHVDGALGNWTGSRSIRLGSWEQEKQIRNLQDLAVLDPSLLTCWMLVGAFVREWLEARAINTYHLVAFPKETQAELALSQEVWALCRCTAVERVVAAFQDTVLRGLERTLGKRREDARGDPKAWIEDPYLLAVLRRDALLAVDAGDGLDSGRTRDKACGLELHQFTQGACAPGSDPVLADAVYEFWNINSLIRALRSAQFPDQAVVVCLIRDPEEPLHSFFVLGIRNGDVISVLTDRSKAHQEHPLRKKLGRKPDRELDARSSRWWFPYELIDTAVTADGKEVYAKARTALVPLNAEAAPLRALADLHPATLVWLALVLDLVRVRFFLEDRRALTVSYTAEMIRVPHALIDARAALVREGQYAPLDLPPLDVARDLSPENMAAQMRSPATGWNRWMVDRYGDRVPEELLDVVGEDERKRLVDTTRTKLPMPGGEIITPFPESSPHFHTVDHSLSIAHLPHRSPDNGVGPVKLLGLDPTVFGSAERLQRDRLWTAQYNRMQVIQRLAVDEFARTRDDVLSWYAARVQANGKTLQEALARLSFTLPFPRYLTAEELKKRTGTDWPFQQGLTRWVAVEEEALRWGVGPAWHSSVTRWYRAGERTDAPRGSSEFVYAPNIVGKKRSDLHPAGVFGVLNPVNAEAVARVCGVTVADLPWQLQHYTSDLLEPYRGNSNLDRLDPQDSLENPWNALPLCVGVSLTRVEINAKRKALKLPRVNWDDPFGKAPDDG